MKKLLSMSLIIMFFLTYSLPTFAVFDKSNLYMTHYTDYYLQFSNGNKIRTAVVVYDNDGKQYPAYCLEPNKDGIGEVPGYEVEWEDISKFPEFNESVTDDGVWRIITHGYPYLTPEKMGVNNNDEAYMATKQALYRYLAGEDVTYYGGGGIGEAGERVYNAIARLLDYGYNYSEQITNATANITLEKPLNFDSINAKFYSATYSVSSNTTFQNYQVEIDTNGVLITDINNIIKNDFKVGEKFKILVPKNDVSSDFNIEIKAYLSCETKPIFYGKSANANTQSYVITTAPYQDIFTSSELKIKKLQEKGQIIISKIDEDTKEKIAGVTFELYKDGTKIETEVTNNEGIIMFSNLDEGSYMIKEVQTDNDYILNKETEIINLGINEQKQITITNEHKKGSLKIIKLDKDNPKIPLEGITFSLYSKELDKTIGTYTTDVDGEIFVENLRTGDYIIHEETTNKWYKEAEDAKVTINTNEITEIKIFNELKKGQVKIVKQNSEDSNIHIANVKFNVMNKEGKILETIITDSNGEATTKKYPIQNQYIYLQEISTDNEYILNNEIHKVELEEDKVITKIITNDPKKGKIQITKKDFDDGKLMVSGATFEIINDQTGQVVDTITTWDNGIAISKELSVVYTYSIKEISTNKKYKLNDNPIITVELKLEGDTTKELKVTNEKRKGQIKVIKVDKDNNKILLEGVIFDILDEQENVVDILTTDKRGEAISKLLPCIDEKYIIREKSTKIEYVLSDETKEIILEENKITSIQFKNEKIKGQLKITKVDSKNNSKTLSGATFGIYNKENKLIQEVITNENGIAVVTLPYGEYTFKELSTGSIYYFINENVYNFEIRKNKEIVERTVENIPVDIKVNVEKKGSEKVEPNHLVEYKFFNIQNTSNTYLDNFKWYDYIPTDYVRIQQMTTGTWEQELKYSVYYKTNKSDKYILFKNNLDTTKNYTLNFTEVSFAENEYITEVYFDFGKIDIGFREKEAPTMKCIVLDNLKSGQTFTNNTKVVGTYGEITSEDTSYWPTIINIPKSPIRVLPKTGK